MNEIKKTMLERLYSLDETMSIEKIIGAKDNQTTIIGKILLWNSVTKEFKVYLGNGLYGFLPVMSASIYNPLLPNGQLSASIRSVIGKPITLTVKDIESSAKGYKIILSRKELMLESFDFVSNCIGKQIECYISSFSSFGIFVVVGNGLNGLIHYEDLCTSRIQHFSDIGLNVGDMITAKVIGVNNNFQISLNYKDQFENLAHILNRDDLIEAKLLSPINSSGYFAYLNPNSSAVVDIPEEIPCKYGDKVVARVKGQQRSNPNNLRLTFVSFIE